MTDPSRNLLQRRLGGIAGHVPAEWPVNMVRNTHIVMPCARCSLIPAFERLRNEYLDDESFRSMQNALMDDPSAGDVIQGTGGLRRLRWSDKRRGKGKRGGLRVIYFYWVRGLEFWLFTPYDKNELSDLSKKDRVTLEGLLKTELKMRKKV